MLGSLSAQDDLVLASGAYREKNNRVKLFGIIGVSVGCSYYDIQCTMCYNEQAVLLFISLIASLL